MTGTDSRWIISHADGLGLNELSEAVALCGARLIDSMSGRFYLIEAGTDAVADLRVRLPGVRIDPERHYSPGADGRPPLRG